MEKKGDEGVGVSDGFESGLVETFVEGISAESSNGGGESRGDGRGGGPNLPYPSSSYASSARAFTPTTTIPTAAIYSLSDGVWDGVAHDIRGGRGAFRPIVETTLATTGVPRRTWCYPPWPS